MSMQQKRPRTDASSQYVVLCGGLRQVMGDRRFVDQSELTRDVLLAYLKSTGEIKDAEIFTVTVQGLSGASFPVKVEKGADVSQLKALVVDLH
jgi:hypothetical protein